MSLSPVSKTGVLPFTPHSVMATVAGMAVLGM